MVSFFKALVIEAREYGTIDLKVDLNKLNWRRLRMA